jgi:hypothetical protein
MTIAALVVTYVIACLLTGLLGRERRMGYTGTVLLSLFITPLGMLLILALTGPSSKVEWRRRQK